MGKGSSGTRSTGEKALASLQGTCGKMPVGKKQCTDDESCRYVSTVAQGKVSPCSNANSDNTNKTTDVSTDSNCKNECRDNASFVEMDVDVLNSEAGAKKNKRTSPRLESVDYGEEVKLGGNVL